VLYGSLALARLGAAATATASCAEADRALLLPGLEAAGLQTSWLPSTVTTGFSFHYQGDERVMTVDAVGDPWSPARAVTATAGASHVHVGALLRTDFPPATLAALAESGAAILIDAQGLVRRAEPGPLREDGEIGDALRHVTILKLDEGEATALAGGTDVLALRALGVPEVVLTLGSRGSLVVTATSNDFVAATPVTAPVDPTGAGDSFAAAYLWFRADQCPPPEAAEHASRFVATLLAERSR
jgi:sugar/nucleoside kinase (ribokinase family)